MDRYGPLETVPSGNTHPCSCPPLPPYSSSQLSLSFLLPISYHTLCVLSFITSYIHPCTDSGCAPTAQAASQQGKYLGRLFRDTKLSPEAVAAYAPFEFHYKGSLAYLGDQHNLITIHHINTSYKNALSISRQFYSPPFNKTPPINEGDGKGVAEIRGLWDHYPGQQGAGQVVGGTSAFALWRSLYFSKLMSSRNQTQVVHNNPTRGRWYCHFVVLPYSPISTRTFYLFPPPFLTCTLSTFR